MIGQKVKFKRSSGMWCHGVVKETIKEFVIVEWISADGSKMCTKKVHQLSVIPINLFVTKKFFVLISIVIIVLLLLDSYFFVKKVLLRLIHFIVIIIYYKEC